MFFLKTFSMSLQKLVYDKKYDAVLRPLAKNKKNVEETLEAEGLAEDWKKIAAMRENELAEEELARKARAGESMEDPAPEATALTNMRQPSTQFAENSESYWLSLANATVRRLVSFVVVPATQGQVQRVVSQSALKDIDLPEGCEKKLGRI